MRLFLIPLSLKQVLRKCLFMGAAELENTVTFYKFTATEIQIFRKNMSLVSNCTDEKRRVQGFRVGISRHAANYQQSYNCDPSLLSPMSLIFVAMTLFVCLFNLKCPVQNALPCG